MIRVAAAGDDYSIEIGGRSPEVEERPVGAATVVSELPEW
jgi:hypothetical protein